MSTRHRPRSGLTGRSRDLPVAGINLVLFLPPSGYLLTRGYFDVMAPRRLDAAARRLRNRAGRILASRAALSGRFAPAPAAGVLVRGFEALPPTAPLPAAGSAA
jgi:hypothetical protein